MTLYYNIFSCTITHLYFSCTVHNERGDMTLESYLGKIDKNLFIVSIFFILIEELFRELEKPQNCEIKYCS